VILINSISTPLNGASGRVGLKEHAKVKLRTWDCMCYTHKVAIDLDATSPFGISTVTALREQETDTGSSAGRSVMNRGSVAQQIALHI
jgi:hypothetical protein